MPSLNGMDDFAYDFLRYMTSEQMKLIKTNVVYRQGVEVYMDDIKVGYFACSGFDACELLILLHMLCKHAGVVCESNTTDLFTWVTS